MIKKVIPLMLMLVISACSHMETANSSMSCCKNCECCQSGQCECCKGGACGCCEKGACPMCEKMQQGSPVHPGDQGCALCEKSQREWEAKQRR